MAEGKPVTTWACDRCLRSETLPSTEQPKGWLAAYLIVPPRQSPCEERKAAWLLCPGCDKSLAAWKRREEANDGRS